ncbi:hypothetical protein NDU88_005416 [Pleurodeles waltl]|uniref:Uncharacterized protein n=1 Tax=Pleurodeles waltl TaxID=8319 RepID=A0AAV7N0F4_PLEWA|nr:hypothetical protein NDU88_005416 [Pleurodeles waltl]
MARARIGCAASCMRSLQTDSGTLQDDSGKLPDGMPVDTIGDADLTPPEVLSKPNKCMRSENRAPRKGGSKMGVVRADPMPAAIQLKAVSTGNASWKTTDGEHISDFVKECLK